MITLGINAAFHDSAAVLVVDGRVIAAAEEERFSRIKHAKRPVPFSAWELPYAAIDYCLEAGGTALAGVDHIAYSFDPDALTGSEPASGGVAGEHARRDDEVPAGGLQALFESYIRRAPLQLVDGVPHHLRARFAKESLHWQWHFVSHHLSHQASAFLAAPFDECAVMTLDGRGESATTGYGVWQDGLYRSLGEVHFPSSLGLLYERITSHLGFLHSSDEYKVMALAALGRPRFRDEFRRWITVGAEGQYRVDAGDLEARAGPPRRPGGPLEQHHFDLAASLQCALEDTVLDLAAWLREASGSRHLAMAGGVALNCLMNARLRDSGLFDAVWVQPAAGDAGTALGCALWVDALAREDSAGPARQRARRGLPTMPPGTALAPDPPDRVPGRPVPPTRLGERTWRMDHANLGPEFDDDSVETMLRWAKVPYRALNGAGGDRTAEVTAGLLAGNALVGWFQGRMEFGPRALGARSILASPVDPGMQARLNELKDREDFRPVAPAIPEEDLGHWFTQARANGGRSPFMLFVYGVRKDKAHLIPSACHVDGTARVQTVNAQTHPRFHALLRAFEGHTGVPVLVNTSFNVRGEPIVCTPRDALEAFFTTPLDALVIGSFLVEKPR